MRTILATALVVSAAILLGGASDALAAPADTADGASGATDTAAGATRNPADRQFLARTDYDDADHATQNAVIALARAECAYLDAHGNTVRNRAKLADQTRAAVRYPYLFLSAAVTEICPWNRF